MNYHAHFPAGVAFAAGACLVSSAPLSIPMLLGGGFGGIMPDIDHPSGHSAVASLGEKTGQVASKVTHGHLHFLTIIGKVIDKLALQPLTHAWLWIAKNVLGRAYMSAYESFGRKLGWSGDDPSEHRGGLTHSLSFLILSSLLFYPFAHLLLHDDLVWIGIELGIISHLFADSMCKSGIKWFWPWIPKLGFHDETHEKGNGIRLIPVSWCMSTGKCPTRDAYLELGRGTPRYNDMRKAYYKEKGWQWGFKASAVLLIAFCVLGIGSGSGTVSWGDQSLATSDKGAIAENTKQQQQQAVDEQVVSQLADDGADGASSGATSIGEHSGPTSLTYGDLDASKLPVGIVKMPDESLYVIGVGKVTSDTLNSPNLALTQDEKNTLLAAALAQRVAGIPSEAADAASDASNAVSNAANSASDATRDFNSTYSSGSNNAFTKLLESLFGTGDDSASGFGFLGITPYTNTTSN